MKKENQRLAQELSLLKLSAEERNTIEDALIHETQTGGKWDSVQAALQSAEDGNAAVAQRIDQNYFDSYSQYEIHREMLGDKVGHPPLN